MSDPSLTDFFDRNSSLFTVLGVFGAVAAYFTQLEVESRWQRLGVVSALTIFILTAVAIQRNIPPESSDQSAFSFVINRREGGIGRVVFYVSFYGIVASVG